MALSETLSISLKAIMKKKHGTLSTLILYMLGFYTLPDVFVNSFMLFLVTYKY